ncbi:MAG TPA: hypothetical protein VHR35_02365 [Nocardioides sp.]|jgi:hypothetical protein|nr:hypothetical protein [Nocardioides sp.]
MVGDADAPGTGTHGWRGNVLLGLWPLALTLVLLAPLRHGGHLLARDLVFVPRAPLTDASLGLGGTAPRSVPLDAVVAVLTQVVDGGVLGRVVLVLTLALAGWGVLRLTEGLGATARLAASGFAVWNPFVLERMSLGQWALVLAYATMPWILLAAATYRHTGSRRAFAAATLWSALASLTPTGGLLALATVVTGGATWHRRSWLLVLVVSLAQLPWVVPFLVGDAGRTSDPVGVSVFAPGSDSSGHPALAVLGLGGIWDGLSVPDSRHSPLAFVAIALVAISVLLGARRWWATAGDLAPRLAVLGGVGLALTLLLTTAAGQDVLQHAVTSVPGAGLLRDSQKLLAPFVLLVACLFGAAVDVVVRPLVRHGVEVSVPVGLLLILVPVALVPDGAGAVWRTVEPVRFPSVLEQVATTVDHGPTDRAVVTLPWRSYRNFSWGTGYPSSDPLVRMVRPPVITSDDLAVGRRVVHGESAVAARTGRALAHGRAADVLPGLGVGWVVVYTDDPAAGRIDVSGLQRVLASPQLHLYAVPGVSRRPAPETWRRASVIGVDVLALLMVLLAAVAWVWPACGLRNRGGGVAVVGSRHPPN